MSITYIAPADKTHLGGVKVMYQHSQMLNQAGILSEMYHPEEKGFQCQWFKHQAKIRTDAVFQPHGDFVVLPEIWACAFGTQLIDAGVKYAIFVQNGYLLSTGHDYSYDPTLQSAYLNAEFILSISDYTTELIKLAFPKLAENRIIRQYVSINEHFVSKPKKKIITFMPRKLGHHAKFVCFFLAQYLPPDWCMMPIMDKNEHQVSEMLAESSIFLSFCELEGFGLPPLEAAVCGNAVVGYTGQAAKEYFQTPVFYEVPSGEINTFVETIQAVIRQVDAGLLHTAAFQAGVQALKARYSTDHAREFVLNFAEKALGAISR